MEINCISSPLSQAGGQRSGVGLVSPGNQHPPPPPLLLTCHLSGVNPGEIDRGLLCITDAPLTPSFRKSQGFKSSIQKSGCRPNTHFLLFFLSFFGCSVSGCLLPHRGSLIFIAACRLFRCGM